MWAAPLLVPAHAADLTVVIDDVGYSKSRGLRAVQLPGAVTIAILPFTPHANQLAQLANSAGKDVLIHQPMEPHPAPHVRTEADTLTLKMTGAEFDAMVANALDAFPYRIGMSNHTGSLLTQHRQPMQRLMRHLRDRDLLFLDSRTTAATVAIEVAIENGVTAFSRDVFLDNERSQHAIHAAFEKGLALARHKGSAIMIGHPYPETLSYLESRLASLPGDIRLIGIEALASSYPSSYRRGPDPAPDQDSPRISLGR